MKRTTARRFALHVGAVSCLVLGGCVAYITEISEDAVQVQQEPGVSDGDVLVKAREACGLYGRVPVHVGYGHDASNPFKVYRFACVPPPAMEQSLVDLSSAKKWFKKAREQAGDRGRMATSAKEGI